MNSIRRQIPVLALFGFGALAVHAAEPPPRALLVYAASSLTNVVGALSESWTRASGIPVKLSFASSSILARQVEAGARPDVFISADHQWMDYLQARGLIQVPTRRDLVGNSLVLIAPAGSKAVLKIAPGFPLASALAGGRLATGDPATVPVGRYARSALISLGAWDELKDRLVPADNVRSAMMYVARGDAAFGIVYATDAQAESRVRIVDTFPPGSHAPITYPAAAMRGAREAARGYLDYLGGPAARDTWHRFGFRELEK
ncbi:MAG TPA: molybdate ABC transporter substrate-binding protein [Steroidobacteraceae bacterium]|nr:molybdate ABC transporter substrate-binding protein [Steroidobacteraceae bacterium]